MFCFPPFLLSFFSSPLTTRERRGEKTICLPLLSPPLSSLLLVTARQLDFTDGQNGFRIVALKDIGNITKSTFSYQTYFFISHLFFCCQCPLNVNTRDGNPTLRRIQLKRFTTKYFRTFFIKTNKQSIIAVSDSGRSTT